MLKSGLVTLYHTTAGTVPALVLTFVTVDMGQLPFGTACQRVIIRKLSVVFVLAGGSDKVATGDEPLRTEGKDSRAWIMIDRLIPNTGESQLNGLKYNLVLNVRMLSVEEF
ncbi:hypothetical protein DSO57_1000687 [Entomophthora muscae]|uniref:Uncharacterized protein n=1 Tax=Entomophthora muscae TaxID=34485 RepID=A0ACC2SM10_9FUNG|nr:hypothetical protein DSO57_1000687 [Entomophthora muscae]